MDASDAQLSVKELSVGFRTSRGYINAVEGVSFTLGRGDSLGLVGESGSGKSVTCLASLGLLDYGAAEMKGSVHYAGQNLWRLSDSERTGIYGTKLAYVAQDPLTGLNPYISVGAHITAVLKRYKYSSEDIPIRSRELLEEVGLPGADAVLSAYPHELSGGMAQRVILALALAGNPRLLIADEPTTSLDVSHQAQILTLIKHLQKEHNLGLMVVSHNLGLVRNLCRRVMVLYAGRVMEEGPSWKVLSAPAHPYTRALLDAVPNPGTPIELLQAVQGNPPEPFTVIPGCPFHPRCPQQKGSCREELPKLCQIAKDWSAACYYPLSGEC